jgi:hypothetical protein
MTTDELFLDCDKISNAIRANNYDEFINLAPTFEHCLEMDLNLLDTIYKQRKDMFHYLIKNPNCFKAIIEHDKTTFLQLLDNTANRPLVLRMERYSYYRNYILNYIRLQKINNL